MFTEDGVQSDITTPQSIQMPPSIIFGLEFYVFEDVNPHLWKKNRLYDIFYKNIFEKISNLIHF